MFGFGDLDVLTASETGIEKLRMLRDAKDFKKAMLEAKHELELELHAARRWPPIRAAERGPGPAPVAPAPAPGRRTAPAVRHGRRGRGARSRASADLRDQGAITPEEYEAKKAELLGRL